MSGLGLLVALGMGVAGGAAVGQNPPGGHRVVFAVSSGDAGDWGMALGNIRNLRAGLKPEPVQVEVVAFGGGIAMVKKGSSVEKEIEALEAEGVVFLACENSMRHNDLTLADLVAGMGSTPAGIVEIVRRQEQGWSYIKAGR
jgi:intracellular sulfur oxidation DsrE/DsrF family protein